MGGAVTVGLVRLRAHLRKPDGEVVTRDAIDGIWESPSSEPDQVIGEKMYALPGLVDSHAHFAAPIGKDWKTDPYENSVERAKKALLAGVTLALDKGWSNLNTIRVVEEVDPAVRPEIEAAGIINAVKDGYWPDFAREVTRETFDSAIRTSIEEGKGWVKLVGDWPRKGLGPVSNFAEAQLRAAVKMAETAGSRVAIHTMARETPGMAVRAGVHSIEHGLFLTEEDVAALGERGGMWVPTILRMEAVVVQLGSESSGGKLLIEGLENVRRLMPIAVEAGVMLLAGTDVTVGAHDVALEALRMVEYGLPTRLALEAVSSSGFEATGRSGDFSEGTPANAVFFESNPLEELDVLTRPAAVVRLGKIVA